jgi:predicted dehydrogenase
MKIGILGTGFGKYHAELYKKIDKDCSITIFGRSKDKLDEIQSSLNVSITTNIDNIILDNKIDLVDICLPNHLHAEYTIKALENGKNVFCETPLCVSNEDINLIKEAQAKSNKKVFVNLFIKHEYPYRYLYDIVKKGSLGKLRSLSLQRKTPALWGDLSLDNIVTNLMIHEFDFITWILGIPKDISSYGNNGENGKSNVSCILKYNDTIVSFQSSSMLPTKSPFAVGYEAIFDKGVINYNELSSANNYSCSFVLTTDYETKTISIPEINCYEESIKHVLDCINNNAKTVQGIDNATLSLKLALKLKSRL